MRTASETNEELRKRSDLLWGAGPKSSRGPKASLSPDDVVQAAMEIADEEGLGALSMHVLAAKLGFTTMALYRYFPSKDALIDAIIDAGLGAPPKPKRRGTWRQDVRHWAYAKRAMMIARPWVAELPFVAAPHGPNWLSWHEAFLQAVANTGVGPEDMMDMLGIVDGFVRGNSDTVVSLARAQARGISFEEWAAAVGADLARAINNPDYPVLSAILTSESGGISESSPLPKRKGKPRTMEEHFDFGLERVLDGIQMYIDSQR